MKSKSGEMEFIVSSLSLLRQNREAIQTPGIPQFPLLALTMAPPHPRRPIAKDRFAALFPTLKVQTYHDPAARGPGSHT